MRKLFAIVLVALMILSLPAPVAADWGGETNVTVGSSYETASELEQGTTDNLSTDGDSLTIPQGDSKEQWEISGPDAHQVEADDGQVMFVESFSDGTVIMADAETGDVDWSETFGSFFTVRALDIGDTDAYATYSAGFKALDRDDGSINWEWDSEEGGELDSASVSSDSVFVAEVNSQNIYAVDKDTQEEVWSQTMPGDVDTVHYYDGSVFVSTDDGAIYELDPATGSSSEFTSVPDKPRNLAAADGYIFADSSEDDELQAYDRATGSLEWQFDAPNSVRYIDAHADRVVAEVGDDIYQLTTDGDVVFSRSYDRMRNVAIKENYTFAGTDESLVAIQETPYKTASYTSDSHDVDSAVEGYVDISQTNMDATIDWQGYDGSSWQTVASETSQTSGEKTADLSGESYSSWRVSVEFDSEQGADDWSGEIHADGVRFENTAPTLSNPQPADGGFVDGNNEAELEIDVEDADFDSEQGETVDVTFRDADDDSAIGTDTLTDDGTASTTWSDVVMGENSYYVEASDDWGGETQTSVQTFETPDELIIRDESSPDDKVDEDVEVEVTFFASDQVITRTTDDGVVDLTGLPNEEMVIQTEASGFVNRQTIIRSITEQQEVYLLPENVEQVTTRFTLDDPTGQFDQQSTRAYVQRPIQQDGETTYKTVAADELGSQGWSTILERDQRYRILIEDLESGQERSLGPYVATTSEEVTLKVDEIQFSYEDEDLGYRWDAEYRNETDPSVLFAFEADHSIESLTVEITEGGANDTILLSETYSDTESISEVAFIPDEIDGETSTWVVEWEADIVLEQGGETRVETISGSTVVGPDQMPVDVDGVPSEVLNVVAVFLIIIVGGLFSAANVGVGGVVTSLFAGLLWFIGMLPGAVSGIMIALALMISAMWMARQARGPQ